MLMQRLFNPQEGQRIYHYCSAESFRSIMESGKLRFSDVNMLNDSTEFRWGYSVFEEAATPDQTAGCSYRRPADDHRVL